MSVILAKRFGTSAFFGLALKTCRLHLQRACGSLTQRQVAASSKVVSQLELILSCLVILVHRHGRVCIFFKRDCSVSLISFFGLFLFL